MSLTPEVRDRYIGIIDGILATADLNTISAKQIRKGIQAAVDYDITSEKAAIQGIIMERFDEYNARLNGNSKTSAVEPTETTAPPTPPTTNGHVDPSPSLSHSPVKRQSDSDVSDVRDEAPPAKKRKADTVDADAQMAARLQAEENARARPTRGGNTRKAAPSKKRTPKKKTTSKVKPEDDSDLDDSDAAAPKPERNTGFHKPLMLSPALSALLGGEITLSRPQTVKRLWAHIKANDLQDPNDKRQIICDPAMRAVFKQDKVHMFTMTKILNQNLYTPDE